MTNSTKPDATGQAGNPLVSCSDTTADVIGKVADVLSFLSVVNGDFGDQRVAGADVSPIRGLNLILETCVEALVVAEMKDAIGGAA